MIAMKRPAYTIGSRTGLRTMLSASALVLLLACAGTAAAGDGVVTISSKKLMKCMILIEHNNPKKTDWCE